jgi:hypothetical protein
MDFSPKKTFFLLWAEKSWWSQFMKMLRFFIYSKKMDGSKKFCKKSLKTDSKPLRRLVEVEQSFTAMLLFFMADTV